MRNPIRGTQFRRDVKLAEKRGKDMAKLREVILLLIEGRPLPPRYKDHPLGGGWKHFRDCHIEPDWLLIYKIDGDNLHLVRTGTHSGSSPVVPANPLPRHPPPLSSVPISQLSISPPLNTIRPLTPGIPLTP